MNLECKSKSKKVKTTDLCCGEEKEINSIRTFGQRGCERDCGKMRKEKTLRKQEKTKGKKNRKEEDRIVEQWGEEKKRTGKKGVKKQMRKNIEDKI